MDNLIITSFTLCKQNCVEVSPGEQDVYLISQNENVKRLIYLKRYFEETKRFVYCYVNTDGSLGNEMYQKEIQLYAVPAAYNYKPKIKIISE